MVAQLGWESDFSVMKIAAGQFQRTAISSCNNDETKSRKIAVKAVIYR